MNITEIPTLTLRVLIGTQNILISVLTYGKLNAAITIVCTTPDGTKGQNVSISEIISAYVIEALIDKHIAPWQISQEDLTEVAARIYQWLQSQK